MLKLSCKEEGIDCDFVATGNTAHEVALVALAHARKDHTDEVKDMNDADLIKTFEAKAHV